MNVKTVDARGLSCPQPVIMTKKAIDDGSDEIEVLVNSEVSKENVSRLASKYKMKTEIDERDGDITIRITK